MIYVDNDSTYTQRVYIPKDTLTSVPTTGHTIVLQEKNYSINQNGSIRIHPDAGYDGISGGTIGVYVSAATGVTFEDINIEENGLYVPSGDSVFTGVTVNVDLQGPFDSGYTSGYTDGYATGYTSGSTDGFDSGYTSGHTDGMGEGRAEGIAYQKSLLTTATITNNGTYRRGNGYSAVTVNVQPPLKTKNITIHQNGNTTVTPPQGYYGLDKVKITTFIPGGGGGDWNFSGLTVNENGFYSPEGDYSFSSVTVDVLAKTTNLEVTETENGTYHYDVTGSEVEGYSAVTVNVDVDLEGPYNSGYTSGYTEGEAEGFENGYTSGETVGYNSGYTDGYATGYTSGSTDGYDSGYTEGYTSGETSGFNSGYTSGYTEGYESGYTSGSTDGFESGYTSGETVGYNSGYTEGYSSGSTDGFNSGYTSGSTDGYNSGYTEGYESGYTSGSTDGFESGYTSGYTEGYSSGSTDGYDSGYTEGYSSGETHQKSLLSSLTINEPTASTTSENGWSAVTVNVPLVPIGIGVPNDNGIYTYNPSQYDAAGFNQVVLTVNTTPVFESGYTSGYTVGYASGSTDGYNSGYTAGYNSGSTDGYNSGMTDGYNSGYTVGYNSGYTVGEGVGYSSGMTDGYASGHTDGFNSGYTSGYTIGYNSGNTDGYASGYTDGYASGSTDGYNSGYTIGFDAGYSSGYTEGYASGHTDGMAAQKALLTSVFFSSAGTYTRENGWNEVIVDNLPVPNQILGMQITAKTRNFDTFVVEQMASGWYLQEVNGVVDTAGVPVPLSTSGTESAIIKLYTSKTDTCPRFIADTGISNTIRSVVMSDDITVMSDYMFRRCSLLTAITLSSNLTTIPTYCFDGVSSLPSIVIPSSVTSINADAFDNCTALTSITCYNTTAPSFVGGRPFYGIASTGTLYVPTGSNYSSWFGNGNAGFLPSGWTVTYI